MHFMPSMELACKAFTFYKDFVADMDDSENWMKGYT